MAQCNLPYLSEILDTSQFKKGQANVIIAPCHSGKTTAAKQMVKALSSDPTRVLYLIDTTAGKRSPLGESVISTCTEALGRASG